MNYTPIAAITIFLLILGAAFYFSQGSIKPQATALGKMSPFWDFRGPVSASSCGKFGDVSSCPKPIQPIIVGENNSIYAVHSGSVHDPTMTRRECELSPPLLQGGIEMDFAFQGSSLSPALIGGGNDLSDSYGLAGPMNVGGQAREILIKGSSCNSC